MAPRSGVVPSLTALQEFKARVWHAVSQEHIGAEPSPRGSVRRHGHFSTARDLEPGGRPKENGPLMAPVVTSGHGGLASTYPRAKAMHQARMRIPASTGIQCHPLERQAAELAIECEWRRVGLTRERYLLKVKSGRQQGTTRHGRLEPSWLNWPLCDYR